MRHGQARLGPLSRPTMRRPRPIATTALVLFSVCLDAEGGMEIEIAGQERSRGTQVREDGTAWHLWQSQ
jgi:hypothetical protein